MIVFICKRAEPWPRCLFYMFDFKIHAKKAKQVKKCKFNLKIQAKRTKMHFQFQNSYKKGKNEKKTKNAKKAEMQKNGCKKAHMVYVDNC